jgi:hypothetical protein
MKGLLHRSMDLPIQVIAGLNESEKRRAGHGCISLIVDDPIIDIN